MECNQRTIASIRTPKNNGRTKIFHFQGILKSLKKKKNYCVGKCKMHRIAAKNPGFDFMLKLHVQKKIEEIVGFNFRRV